MAMRERTGRADRHKIEDSGGNRLPLSQVEVCLWREISFASEQQKLRKWQEVQSQIDTYCGPAIKIYTDAMHAALKFRKYEDGALTYEKCRQNCEQMDNRIFTAALKIFGKLGQHEKVRQIWDEAMEKCKLSHMLIASRMHAAADEGDVETAALMLDLLDANKLEIDVIMITFAMRSCWGWGSRQHKAAKYLWTLITKYNSKPNVVAFTTLMGAYGTAPLKDVLAALAEMETMEIPPDRDFVETFLASVLQQDFKRLRQVDEIVHALKDMPPRSLTSCSSGIGKL